MPVNVPDGKPVEQKYEHTPLATLVGFHWTVVGIVIFSPDVLLVATVACADPAPGVIVNLLSVPEPNTAAADELPNAMLPVTPSVPPIVVGCALDWSISVPVPRAFSWKFEFAGQFDPVTVNPGCAACDGDENPSSVHVSKDEPFQIGSAA